MTDPSIYLVNIKHSIKELNELLANAQNPSSGRIAEILVVAKEIEEDARQIKAWSIDLTIGGEND